MENHDVDMHDDDKPVGRLLTRREMMKLLGGSTVAVFAGLSIPKLVQAQTETVTATPMPACVVRPELTEGPYFVANDLNRFDIRLDPGDEGIVKEGLPLLLRYRVSDVSDSMCSPLEGAQVDVWHCDAEGEYSGVQDQGFDTRESLWLRGYQITDEYGVAEFLTIVPGWYSGRAVHIHFKIRTELGSGASYEFTSQFFFEPELIEEIYSEEPYFAKGLPDTPNETDGIYQGSEGQLTLELIPLTEAELQLLNERQELTEAPIERGYVATFDVGLDLSDLAVGANDSAGDQGSLGGTPRGGDRP